MENLKIIKDWGDVIAVNKPAGWLSIPGRGNKENIPVVSNELGKILRGGEKRQENKSDLFIIHRLDLGTSGVMLFSRTPESHKTLCGQFEDGQIKKVYWALVSGEFPESEQIIDAPIFKLPSKKNKSIVDPKGMPSQTRLKRLKTNRNLSLVEARPLTGRPHQIRVHLKHIGFPIVGDKLYGGMMEVNKLMIEFPLLHAHSIEFQWPEKVNHIVKAPLGAEFIRGLEAGAILTDL
jgi:RluA family pseudouridine synthase